MIYTQNEFVLNLFLSGTIGLTCNLNLQCVVYVICIVYYILYVSYVLQHCQFEMFSYTKDLSTISMDLSSIFIIDNSPGAYKSYPGKCTINTNILTRSIIFFYL